MYSHGTATKITANPTLAKVMYTRKPAAVPASETSPAMRPWLTLRDTRYTMFGPGVSAIPSSTRAIPPAAVDEIITHATMSDAAHQVSPGIRSAVLQVVGHAHTAAEKPYSYQS